MGHYRAETSRTAVGSTDGIAPRRRAKREDEASSAWKFTAQSMNLENGWIDQWLLWQSSIAASGLRLTPNT
jgi:hypothetical protein